MKVRNAVRKEVSNEQGFTLIELLVVVIIIGILAAIAIPTFLSQRAEACNADAVSTARDAGTVAVGYYAENESYAGLTAAALDADEPSLPDAESTGKYANPGTYTVTVIGGGIDYQVDVRSKCGDETYRVTDSGLTTL